MLKGTFFSVCSIIIVHIEYHSCLYKLIINIRLEVVHSNNISRNGKIIMKAKGGYNPHGNNPKKVKYNGIQYMHDENFYCI